jgi:hypothetical protein
MLLRRKLLFPIMVLFILLCSSLVISVYAASMWSQTYGGTDDDVAYSLIATSDGGYAMAGSTSSFDGEGIEFWLVKTDSDGVMEWNKTYGNPGAGWESNHAYSLVATSDGGYALAGETWSFGAGMSDYWLVKTDASGNMQWNRTYGGDNVDKAESLVATSDGGYALAGHASSFGTGGVWLVKTDASGNMQWNKTYEGTVGDDRPRSVIATPDGGYALTGGPWFIKTDAFGNMQWNRTYSWGEETTVNGTYSFESYGTYGLVATPDGGYALAGFAVNYTGEPPVEIPLDSTERGAHRSLVKAADKGYTMANEESYLLQGMWLVKTDALGNMLWNKTYNGTGDSWACSLVATSDGGYALSGWTGLVKTDANGVMEWNRTYSEQYWTFGYSLVEASDGGFALAGEKRLYPPFSVSQADFWLIKTDELGVVPEYSSLFVPALVLTATAVLIIGGERKRRRALT